MSNPLLVNIAELSRRAGSEKRLEVSVSVDHFEFGDRRIVGDEIPVSLVLTSVNGGIAVDGTATAGWADECSRCLTPVSGRAIAEVHELFQETVTNPDAYPIVGEQIDLTPMVRELVLLELPGLPLCAEACPGLCPSCGADLAKGACGCAPAVRESPWDALNSLKDQLPEA